MAGESAARTQQNVHASATGAVAIGVIDGKVEVHGPLGMPPDGDAGEDPR